MIFKVLILILSFFQHQFLNPDDDLQIQSSNPTIPPNHPSRSSMDSWYHHHQLHRFQPYQPIHRPMIRVLFMSTVKDSVTRVDTFLYELYEAARYRHPSIEAYFWGPGYHHYYHLDSLNSNLEREFGCGFFKMVILHSGQPEIQDEFDSATQSLGCDTLLLVKSGDCNNNQCLWEANLLHANVTIVRYAHEAIEMFSVERILEMKRYKYGNRNDLAFQLIAHVPDTANEWDFYPLDRWEDKITEALLIGKVDAGYYPLRLTVSEAIKDGKTTIKQLNSPPPFMPPIDHFVRSRPKTLNWNATRHDFQRKILQDFSQSLRSSKICVFDGSIEEKAIRKFSQAMLSGCVIASDLVTEHDGFLKHNIIQLDLYDDIKTINQKISHALSDEHELKRKASACLAYARRQLTGLKELDLLLDLSDRYRAGERGYVFPYGFTSKCRRYHQSDDGNFQFVPPWCRTDERPLGFGKSPPHLIQPGEYHWNGPSH